MGLTSSPAGRSVSQVDSVNIGLFDEEVLGYILMGVAAPGRSVHGSAAALRPAVPFSGTLSLGFLLHTRRFGRASPVVPDNRRVPSRACRVFLDALHTGVETELTAPFPTVLRHGTKAHFGAACHGRSGVRTSQDSCLIRRSRDKSLRGAVILQIERHAFICEIFTIFTVRKSRTSSRISMCNITCIVEATVPARPGARTAPRWMPGAGPQGRTECADAVQCRPRILPSCTRFNRTRRGDWP